ncbi:hypothetical protein C3942_19085 [Solimonas fluminis]|uniref:Uncharacterized protein n=1 Tax=Solimonas fluminis TaxID=2086571 RepID=A0A2S5TB34_9GAMM|nr:hypothetical protein [Solimonas fluminis]PPE72214.1 hypothetical protein C3942_19085 [Solimonas fluminis]
MGIKQGGIAAMLAASVLVLAGCDGVGDGSAPDPDTARIQKVGGTTAFGENKLFTCVPQQLLYSIGFSNGGQENFNDRSRWESSNPSIAIVTNRGDPVDPAEFDEDGKPLVYTVSGLVLPRAPGDVVIKATALGRIQKEFPMTVKNPDGNFRIKATGYGDQAATAIKMSPNTIQQLQLVGTLEGYETDLASALSGMSFTDPDDDDEAAANFVVVSGQATTIVQAVKDLTGKIPTRTVLPTLIACKGDDPALPAATKALFADAKLDVTVAQPTGLLIQRELESPVNGNVLAVIPDSTTTTATQSQTTEVLRTYATFADVTGPAQDLSSQVLASSSKPEVITTSVFLTNTSGGVSLVPTAVRALATGTGTTTPQLSEDVTITYCQPEPVPDPRPTDYVSKCWEGKPTKATIVFKARKSTLTGIAVKPDDGDAPVIEAYKSLQFRAVGTFDEGFQQDITRQVAWTVFANDGTTSSTKVAIGGLNSVISGTAISAFQVNTDTDDSNGTPLQDRTVKIKATNERASTTKTQTVTATISK